MRRIFALALVLLMMLAPTLSIFAEKVTESDASQTIEGGTADQVSGTSDVRYGVERTYTLVIPPVIVFNPNPAEGATDLLAEANIGVNNIALAGTQKIGVTISADSQKLNNSSMKQWWLIDQNGASSNVAYKGYIKAYGDKPMTVYKTLVNGDTILLINAPEGNAGTTNAASGSVTVEFQTNGTTQVGDYEDCLTFTVDVHDAENGFPIVSTQPEAVT